MCDFASEKLEGTVKKGNRESTPIAVLWHLLCSVRLSIFLLILLALTSILGTVIPQNAPPMEYIQQFGLGLYRVLDFLGLFDVYHSWWFRGILGLLAVNIFSCSSNRLPRIWSRVTRPREEPDTVKLMSLPYTKELKRSLAPEEVTEKTASVMRKVLGNPLVSETPEAITLFAERGRLSRFGVYLTHLSILIILFGALIGSLIGFRGFVNILEGDTVDRIFMRDPRGTAPKPLGFEVKCNDFRITYYDVNHGERLVKEYVSTLTFLESGREVMKKEVRVNHPLTFNGLRFYQSSYGSIPEITVTVSGKNREERFSFTAFERERVRIPEWGASFQVLKYHPQIHDFGEGIAVALHKPEGKPKRFMLLKAKPKTVEDHTFTLNGVTQRQYTGLQVTRDPGVGVVWTGCILLVLGLIVAFFLSHQRIWIRIPKGKPIILVSGAVNKNRMAFERKFNRVTAALEGGA